MYLHSLHSGTVKFFSVKLCSTRVILLVSIIGSAIMLLEKCLLVKNETQGLRLRNKGMIREFFKQTELTAFALPPSCICLSCNHVQFVSNWVERTNVKWTPKLRCTAEQSMQMNTPYVTVDHVGFLALQSKQTWKWRGSYSSHKPARTRPQVCHQVEMECKEPKTI